MFQKTFDKLWQEAHNQNTKNIVSLLVENSHAVCIDIGCGDGKKTTLFKKKINSKEMLGTDGIKIRLTEARKNGIDKIIFADLEKKWPLQKDYFDVVISNQVIEHILNLD